ncbi:protein of unknown function [Oscillibacter sp. PC13]|uniref:DUF4358 domain-containing protein n=1 Tax=Oscillibacter sp. PC13 TaxID=1855299 RepID=UPI0008E6E5B6|nr:DUF4358 domain-containing protein [Oscillibacter sp. PC13]SFP35444.1 protein of unknown function [Oscillibacter sp. PC13]
MRRNLKIRFRMMLLATAMALLLTACGTAKDVGTSAPVESTGAEDGVDGTVEMPVERPEDETELGEIQNADGSTAIIADGEELLPDGAEPRPGVGQRPADNTQHPELGGRPANPAEKPEGQPVEKPTDSPAQKPENTPAEQEHVDLNAFYNTLASGAGWPAMMQAEGETMDAFYTGLAELATEQCGVYMAMISAVAGEIALVEVSNAADVQTVKDIFQARINYQVGDHENPGGAWYPDSIQVWENNSRIVTQGNYVMMIAMEGADDIVASFNALFV